MEFCLQRALASARANPGECVYTSAYTDLISVREVAAQQHWLVGWLESEMQSPSIILTRR